MRENASKSAPTHDEFALSIAFEYNEKTIDKIERDTQMTLWPLLEACADA